MTISNKFNFEFIDRNQSWEKRNSTIFPNDITIEDCREAIKGCVGFRETNKNGLICFNYDFCFRDSFPDPSKESDPKKAFLLKVKRECRGIMFHEKTGEIICRKLHKFFNINEIPETNQDVIELNENFILLEKLDGSLIAPILVDGKVTWGSKAGITDLTSRIENHINKKFQEEIKVHYNEFAQHCMVNLKITPLFEWCSVANQIVLFYPIDKLHLIAMRNMITGEYLTHEEMIKLSSSYNVPVVECVNLKENPKFKELYSELSILNGASDTAGKEIILKNGGVKKLLELVQSIEQIEGFILKFDSGRTYKLKTNWYFEFHGITVNKYSNEKDIFYLILNDGLGAIDDLISKIAAKDPVPQRFYKIQEFGSKILERVEQLSIKVIEYIFTAKKDGKMRRNISVDNNISNNFKKFVFQFYDEIEPTDNPNKFIGPVTKFITEKLKLLSLNATKLEEVKIILGGNLTFEE